MTYLLNVTAKVATLNSVIIIIIELQHPQRPVVELDIASFVANIIEALKSIPHNVNIQDP